MRDDFCAFILTHGRPNDQYTLHSLKESNYTGKTYLVIDDEDKKADEYKKLYGDKVLQFCKKDIAAKIDQGDNFDDRRAIIYARNACFELAEQVGVKYFIQLDDDYTQFFHRVNSRGEFVTQRWIRNIDPMFEAMCDFIENSPAICCAFGQAGDYLGGPKGDFASKTRVRKCMNSIVCSVDKPFQYFGRINEDVNTYATLGNRGELMLTFFAAGLTQTITQKTGGGMSDMYVETGTYVKSFYTVMYMPSSTKISVMGLSQPRIHHKITWENTTPKIIRETHRKRR
jgi:hypothetical protein